MERQFAFMPEGNKKKTKSYAKETDTFLVGRHSIKPREEDKESERYVGISKKGVELAADRVYDDMIRTIMDAESSSIIFFGGTSGAERTKSTAEVYGDALKDALSHHDREYKVLTREEIENMKEGDSKVINKISEIIEENPYSKIIIDYPLFLKEMDLDRNGIHQDGKLSPYFEELFARNNNDDVAAFRDWIITNGEIGELHGVKPEESAKRYINAMERLRAFAKKYAQGRPLVIGLVGHSWELDALFIYLANNGKIDLDGFEEFVGEPNSLVRESEIAKIELGDNIGTIEYRGVQYQIGI